MLFNLFTKKKLEGILNYYSLDKLEELYTIADKDLSECIKYKTNDNFSQTEFNDYSDHRLDMKNHLSFYVVRSFQCMAQVKQILKIYKEKNGNLPDKYSSLLEKNENIEKIFALCDGFKNEVNEYTDYMNYFYNIALTGNCNYSKEELKNIDIKRCGDAQIVEKFPTIIEFIQRDKEKNPNFLHSNQDEMRLIECIKRLIVNPELKKKYNALVSYVRANHTNSELLGRVQGILGYYRDNKDADPNAFEFIGVSEEVARHMVQNLSKDTNKENLESQKTAVSIYKNYLVLSDMIKERFIKNGIVDENDPLYKMIDTASNNAKNGIVSDDDTVKYRQMLAGMSLYCKQMNAKNGYVTPNKEELNTLLELSEKCYDENATELIEYISECYSDKKTKTK